MNLDASTVGGNVTLSIHPHGNGAHEKTVPFSFTFTELGGNRVDVYPTGTAPSAGANPDETTYYSTQ